VILLVVSVAVALSMDACAVAVGAAAAQGGLSARQLARLAGALGGVVLLVVAVSIPGRELTW
jgi:hypothetical protein